MDKPDLNRMWWHTWVKIGPKIGLSQKMIQSTIRRKISPLVSRLKDEGTINWYHFLLHEHPRDKANAYFHVRFSTIRDIVQLEDLNLPEYCDSTKRIDPILDINGIDKTLLKNGDLRKAWRIIGEQSEWIMDMMNIYREGTEIPINQIVQFMHYYMNMMGLGHQSILLLGPFFRY